MKTNDEILKYLAGLLQGQEKEKFEKELMQSEELKKELQKQQNILSGLKNIGDIPADNSYFTNLLPNVRQQLERKKKFRLYPKLAYALPVAAVIAYFVINPFSHKDYIQPKNDIGSAIAQMPEETKSDILGDIIEDESKSTVHAQVVSDSSNTEVLEKNIVGTLFTNDEEKAKYLDTDDLIGSLSNEEALEVYNSLKHKKIL